MDGWEQGCKSLADFETESEYSDGFVSSVSLVTCRILPGEYLLAI